MCVCQRAYVRVWVLIYWMKHQRFWQLFNKFFTQHSWTHTHTNTLTDTRIHTGRWDSEKGRRSRKGNRNGNGGTEERSRKCTLNQCFFWPLLHFRSCLRPRRRLAPSPATWQVFRFALPCYGTLTRPACFCFFAAFFASQLFAMHINPVYFSRYPVFACVCVCVYISQWIMK